MQTSEIIRMANSNLAFMDGTTGPVKTILAACDIVFAVWPDSDHSEGADTLVIKGAPLLRKIADGGVSRACRLSAVWVNSPEMALATGSVFGDQQTGDAHA